MNTIGTKGVRIMNESIIIPILTFLVGGIVGAIITAKVVRKDYAKRIDQLTYENNYLQDRSDRLLTKNEELVGQMEQIVDEPLTSLREAQVDRATFERLSKKYKDPDFDEHFAQRVGPDDDLPLREPFLISEEDFDIICGEMGTEEFCFYQVDEVLTDINDVPVDDPWTALGESILSDLAETSLDLIHVQNDTYGVVYEITIEHNLSYHRDVLGEERDE